MYSARSHADIASSLLTQQGLQLQSLQVIQPLWAGYGHICQITASPFSSQVISGKSAQPASTADSTQKECGSYVIKIITPPPVKVDDEGHMRKLLSYQVEQRFYTHLAPLMPQTEIPVAQCIASLDEDHVDGTSTSAILLSDLRQKYPVAGEKRSSLTPIQVQSSLDWLSSFHGFWWTHIHDIDRASLIRPPLEEMKCANARAGKPSVWLNGGYTYLATRRSEYKSLFADDDSEWRELLIKPIQGGRSLAEAVAYFLAPSENGSGPTDGYQTLIHGDVKSENLFTSPSGKAVAFYDFQYTGLGLGVCDLAKLFTCSVPLHMLLGDAKKVPWELDMQSGERALLQSYLSRLIEVSGKKYDWDVFSRHWETALVDWLRFQASWGFWGNTQWLEARVRSILKDEGWRTYVKNA